MGEATKTNKLAHHTFAPWKVDGDRRIVAGEQEWDAVKGLDIAARHMHQRRRVMVGVDVFEDYCVRVNGGPLTDVVNPITMHDVRNRLFRLIDSTPNLDWLLFTRWPENVAGMLPLARCIQCGEHCGTEIRQCRNCSASQTITPFDRLNLFLGTDIDDQATADERIPHLLRVPAKVRMVRYSGVGKVEFSNASRRSDYVQRLGRNAFEGIHLLIISGEVGPDARPCNLEHVRDAIGQAKAAGVPVWVERLGSCVVGLYHERLIMVGKTPSGINCPVRWILRDPHGADPAEWSEDLRIWEVPT